MNVILRPVCKNPEALYLSILYEIKARKYFDPGNLMTLFVVDKYADEKVVEMINQYPFKCEILTRGKSFDKGKSFMLGMKSAFKVALQYVICIDEFSILHRTYFEYIDMALKGKNKYSVISPKTSQYCPVEGYSMLNYVTAVVITKEFFSKYLSGCISKRYFDNKNVFMKMLDTYYGNKEEYGRYLPTEVCHLSLLDRLVKISIINEDLFPLYPEEDIVFNTESHSSKLKLEGFDRRLSDLRNNIRKGLIGFNGTKENKNNSE